MSNEPYHGLNPTPIGNYVNLGGPSSHPLGALSPARKPSREKPRDHTIVGWLPATHLEWLEACRATHQEAVTDLNEARQAAARITERQGRELTELNQDASRAFARPKDLKRDPLGPVDPAESRKHAERMDGVGKRATELRRAHDREMATTLHRLDGAESGLAARLREIVPELYRRRDDLERLRDHNAEIAELLEDLGCPAPAAEQRCA